jgi:phosphate/sulfate permease
METVQAALWVVILLVALALIFDFMNGFHDAANSIATVVSTGVLKPGQAVVFAAFFNFIAIFVFHLSVAATVGKGIVQPGVVDTHVVFGALVGAITWNVITWYYGIPSSSSHALIGGIVGAVIAKAGAGALISTGIMKTVAFIFVSPLLGFLLGSLMMVAVAHLFRRARPSKVDKWFRRLQLVSAGAYSLGHGGNELGDWFGHHVWWLANRQDHGSKNHQAQTCRRLLCRNGRCHDLVFGHHTGYSGVDHPHHHRGHCGRGLYPAGQRRALGCGGQHCVGMGVDHSGQCFCGRFGLLDEFPGF